MRLFWRSLTVLLHLFTTKRKIALFDVDRTSYQGLLVTDLFNYQYRQGTIPEESFEAFHHTLNLYRINVYTYEEMADQLLADWAGGIKGHRVTVIEQQTREFFETEEGKNFFPFVRETIELFRTSHDIYFVTAEPQFVAQVIAEMFQATGYRSSTFEVKNGIITGRVTLSLGQSREKEIKARWLLRSHIRKNSFAFGDSEGDAHMLAGVEHPVCVNPTIELRIIAERNGWVIATPDDVTGLVRILISDIP